MVTLVHLLVSILLLGPSMSSRDAVAAMVDAPNRGRTVADLGQASPDDLARRHAAAEFRTAVDRPGVPAASIDAFAFEPRDETLTVRLRDDGRTFAGYDLAPRPSTRPAGERVAAKGTVFVLHGLRGSKERRFEGTLPPVFTTAGYRVIQPDLRGHGRSTGDFLSYGVFDSADLSAVLDEATRRGLVTQPVFAFGVSLGASTAVEWAGADDRVRAVVAVSPFASMRAVVADVSRRWMGRWHRVAAASVPGLIDQAGRLAGFDPDAADVVGAAARAAGRGVPILVMHGTADTLVPTWHGRAVATAAGELGRFVPLEGENHWTPWFYRVPTIRDEALAWFDAAASAAR